MSAQLTSCKTHIQRKHYIKRRSNVRLQLFALSPLSLDQQPSNFFHPEVFSELTKVLPTKTDGKDRAPPGSIHWPSSLFFGLDQTLGPFIDNVRTQFFLISPHITTDLPAYSDTTDTVNCHNVDTMTLTSLASAVK